MDRIIFCANSSSTYLFFTEKPNGKLDQYCRTKAQEIADLKDGRILQALKQVFHSGNGICHTDDARRASASLFRDIFADPRFHPGRAGLRLIGGIYCDEILLQEITTGYSIILDGSVLFKGITLRNATIKGDLSLDNAQIAGPIKIWRSTIRSSVFGTGAVIEALGIYDSTINRSLHLSDSVFPGTKKEPTAVTIEIDRTNIGGEVLVEKALVGPLLLQNSDIGSTLGLKHSTFLEAVRIEQTNVSGAFEAQGADFSFTLIRNSKFSTVDLHETEFRCTLIAAKNYIGGDFNLADSGLGRSLPVGTKDAAGKPISERRWSAKREARVLTKAWQGNIEAGRSEQIIALIKSSSCKFEAYTPPHEIRLTDNTIGKNLCIKSIQFERRLATQAGQLDDRPKFNPSYISLSGSHVGGNTILSLWHRIRNVTESPTELARQLPEPLFFKFITIRKSPVQAQKQTSDQQIKTSTEMKCPIEHCLELLGLESGGVVIDIEDTFHQVGMFTTGMKFDRMFQGNVNCPYPRTTDTVATEGQMFLPSSTDVIHWLENGDSTQPFAATIDAFVRAGSDATDLKVRKAELEWNTRYEESQHQYEQATGDKTSRIAAMWVASTWTVANAFNLIHLYATRALGLLADYGYRPTKALLWVSGIIAVYAAIFWFVLGVIAFKPAKKGTINPMGFIFLFDRFIPVYQIREDNYAIKEFYKWDYTIFNLARDTWKRIIGAKKVESVVAEPVSYTHYFWTPIPVSKASPTQIKCAQALLDGLKMLGAILAVFLVAALNTLIAQ
jgi:hypothetical protein